MSGPTDVQDRADLTKAELAEVLGKKKRHVSDLVTGKKIGFYWAGNNRDPRFPWADVVTYLEQLRRQNRVEPENAAPPQRKRTQTSATYAKAVAREKTRRTKTEAAVQ